MPKLADTLLAKSFRSDMDDPPIAMLTKSMPPILSTAPVVDINNIAQWASTTYIDEEPPSIAPPWPTWWMEYRVSARGTRATVGFLFSRKEIPGDDLHDWQIEQPGESPYAPQGTKWVLCAIGYVQLEGDRGTAAPEGVWEIAVDDRGRKLDMRYAELVEGSRTDAPLISVPLWALSFMQCRNIRTERVTPPDKINRKYQQRHNRPLVRYHVIKLQPLGGKQQGHGRVGGGGGEQGLHIVPGGFHHYGDCCPPKPDCPHEHGYSRCKHCGGHTAHGLLFGREGGEGMYWVETHARGNARRGQIVSDYTVDMSEANPN